MRNSHAIKIIAAYALVSWATASFSHVSVESKGPASSLPAAVPAANVSLVAAASEPVKVMGGWVRSTVPGQKGSGAFMKITATEGVRLTDRKSVV